MGRVAHVRLVNSPHYRPDAFRAGLELHGYTISDKPSPDPKPGDVIVCWNRYERDEKIIRAYERAGAYVIITENSWLGPEQKDQHLFALALNHHNGAGRWHVGDKPRWHLECQPWRKDGEHILVLPQRGMGEHGVRQPQAWRAGVVQRLAHLTDRPIRIRYHPGFRPHPPIDFTDTWAVVTWASGAAIKAIVAGYPCFYEFPKWIGAPAARWGIDDLENPFLGDRSLMLHRLSWATWSAEEIARGEPFEWLLKSAYLSPKSVAGGSMSAPAWPMA